MRQNSQRWNNDNEMRQNSIILQQPQTFLQAAKKCETAEAELSKVEFKVNSCVEELAKMDQFAKVIAVIAIIIPIVIIILATIIIFTRMMMTRWQRCESWRRRWQRSRDLQRQRR